MASSHCEVWAIGQVRTGTTIRWVRLHAVRVTTDEVGVVNSASHDVNNFITICNLDSLNLLRLAIDPNEFIAMREFPSLPPSPDDPNGCRKFAQDVLRLLTQRGKTWQMVTTNCQ
jgi:hypothetical protein